MKVPKLKIPQSVRYVSMGLACSVLVWCVGIPVYSEFNSSFAMKEFKQYGVIGTYHKHFFSFTDGLHEIFDLDQENIRLNEQVAKLETELQTEKTGKVENEAKAATETVAAKLKAETGSELARTLETIPYSPPTNILPHQLYVLGVSYFRKAEYEESAVIFSKLLKLKEDVSYQKPENFILAGISWYQLKQYHLAQEFFTTAKERSAPQDANYRSVIVWEALLGKAQGKKQVVEEKVEQLMAQFPHSEELRLMRGEDSEPPKRAPASRESHEREFPSNITEPKETGDEDGSNEHTSLSKPEISESAPHLAKKGEGEEASHE